MNILVTGSSGFIARFLIPQLLERGHNIVGIDTRVESNFGAGVRFVQVDILDRNALERVMHKSDMVVHLAAEHKDFGVPEERYYQVNAEGTESLLQCAAQQNVRSFIFFSSVAVYGERSTPTDETLVPEPDLPYGKSKLMAEQAVQAWVSQGADRRAVIIRPTVIFGPHNYHNMYRLIHSIDKGRYVSVGDGANIKSVAYVENVVAATLFLMERMKEGLEIYNYADSPHLITRDLVGCIANALQVRVPAIRIPKILALACALPFDILAKVTRVDLPLTAKRVEKFTAVTHHQATKIRNVGFIPPYILENAIRKTVDWYRAVERGPHLEGTKSDIG
jgi:nucleoside-diphosphate-sugar epimerase